MTFILGDFKHCPSKFLTIKIPPNFFRTEIQKKSKIWKKLNFYSDSLRLQLNRIQQTYFYNNYSLCTYTVIGSNSVGKILVL